MCKKQNGGSVGCEKGLGITIAIFWLYLYSTIILQNILGELRNNLCTGLVKKWEQTPL